MTNFYRDALRNMMIYDLLTHSVKLNRYTGLTKVRIYNPKGAQYSFLSDLNAEPGVSRWDTSSEKSLARLLASFVWRRQVLETSVSHTESPSVKCH